MSSARQHSPGLQRALGRILHYAGGERWSLVGVALLSLLDMGLNAQLSLSFKYLIDGALTQKNGRVLAIIIGALCASVVIVLLAGLWRDRLYAEATGQFTAGLRSRLYSHILRLSAGFYSRTPAGEIVSRFSSDLAEIEKALLNAVPWAVVPSLDALISTVLIFWLDWRLALLAILAFPLSMLGPRAMYARTAEASLTRRQFEAGLLNRVAESVAAQSLIRAFSLENFFLRSFHADNIDVQTSSKRLGFLMLLMERSAVVSTQVLQVMVIAGGGYLVFKGQMSIGTFAAFQSIFVTLTSSLSYIAQYAPQISQAGGCISHIEELLAESPQVCDSDSARDIPELSGSIELEAVSFSYDGNQKNLNGVNLKIPRGASVAFVGPSGSGKSTILNLVMRFYDPSHGSVRIDGNDLRTISQESLRARTAVVFQENYLLNASIRDNIRIANPLATEERIQQAAMQAGLHEFIAGLPEGYGTVVAQGRLSGGQRQRLGIARALIRDPHVLLLDEATSALDSVTEAQINATIEHAARGRTVLSVTHRLGAAVKADRIFYLEKGIVVEQGTHQELLAVDGAYARMWKKQSGFHLNAEGDARISPERLRTIPVLSDLDESVLAELSKALTTELCSKDQYLFHEGDTGDKFYILVRGTVEVLKASKGSGVRRVEVLQDGDTFGEQALLMNAPRSASIRSLAECTFLVLAGDKFRTLIARTPQLRYRLRENASIGEYRNDEAAAGTVSPWSKYRHDLLTPVNHLVGYGEMLEEELEDCHPGASRFAAAICAGARDLHASIDRLLPSGRPIAGNAMETLRAEVEAPLRSIESSVESVRAMHSLTAQVLSDVERVSQALCKFRHLVHDRASAPTPRINKSPQEAAHLAVAGAPHILVVDDNETSRDLLCRKLERDGYHVSAAEGGLAAMDAVRHGSFDLVLLDVMMPDVDGIEVLREWRLSGLLAELPVIVTSAMDEVQNAVRCIELGAEDYLTKPFDPVLLETRIGTSIERKKRRDIERAQSEQMRVALERLNAKECATGT